MNYNSLMRFEEKRQATVSESDLQVNLSCELRAATEPTICSRCVRSIRPFYPLDAPFPGDRPDMRCILHRVLYLNDSPTQFALCADINTSGTCPEFKARPAPKCVVIENVASVTIWQKIKKLFS